MAVPSSYTPDATLASFSRMQRGDRSLPYFGGSPSPLSVFGTSGGGGGLSIYGTAGGGGGVSSFGGGGGGDATVAELLGGERPYEGLGKTSLNLTPVTGLQTTGEIEAARLAAARPPQPGLVEGILSGLTSFATGLLPRDIQEPIVGAAGQLGHLVDIPLDWLGHVPLPFTKSREEAFAMLPMTDEKRTIQQMVLSDPVVGGQMMAAYIREHEGDLMSLQGLPRTLSTLLRPDATILERLLSLMGVAGDAVARTYAGTSLRDAEGTILNADPRTLPPDLAVLAKRRRDGEITQDQFLDDLTQMGMAFSNDPFTNFVASMVTDPLIGLNLGAGLALRAARTGAVATRSARALQLFEQAMPEEAASMRLRMADREVARATESGRVLDRDQALNTYRDQINTRMFDEMNRSFPQFSEQALGELGRSGRATVLAEPGIRRIAAGAARINDPLSMFGGGRVGKGMNEYMTDRYARGVTRAYGIRNWRRFTSYARIAGSTGIERLENALKVAMANSNVGYYQHSLIGNVKAGMTRIPDPDGPSPNQLIRAAQQVHDPTMVLAGEAHARRVIPDLVTPAAATGQAAADAAVANAKQTGARQYSHVTGMDTEQAVTLFKNADNEMLALAEFAYWGESIRSFKQALGRARERLTKEISADPEDALAKTHHEWMQRGTLVGVKELTQGRAEALLEAARRGDMAALERAVSQYDLLYDNFSRAGAKGEDLAQEVQLFLTDLIESESLIKTIPYESLPAELRDWLDANAAIVGKDRAYEFGLSPTRDKHWRVSKDETGRVLGVNPWVDLVDDSGTLWNPTRLDRVRTALFAPIRGERLLDTARRRFRNISVTKHHLSRAEADGLFDAIRREASRQNVLPRGLTGRQFETVAREVYLDPAVRNKLGERGLTMLVAQAFEGDLMEVGLSVKATGWSKARTAGWGNYVSLVAERVYPFVRFTVNPIFQLQELVEPWFLNGIRGIKPGIKWSKDDQAALALIDRFNLGDPFSDQAEYVHLVAQGWANSTSKGFGEESTLARRLGRIPTANVQRIKRLNYARQFRTDLGAYFKESANRTSPGLWAQLEREFGTADPAKIAQRYFVERGHLHPDDPDFAVLQSVATQPDSIGKRARVRLDTISREMGFVTAEGLREAVTKGTLLESDFRDQVKNLYGWNDDFITRSWRVASFHSPKTFFNAWTNALIESGNTRVQAELGTSIAKTTLTNLARISDTSLEEYLANNFSDLPRFLTSEGQIPLGALTQSVEGMVERLPTPDGGFARAYRREDPEFQEVQARQQEVLPAPSAKKVKAQTTKATKAAANDPAGVPMLHSSLKDGRNNDTLKTYDPKGDGTPSVSFGKATNEQHAERIESLLGRDELDQARRWYDVMTTLWMGLAQNLDDIAVKQFNDWMDETMPASMKVNRMADERMELAARMAAAWGGSQQRTTVLDGYRYVQNLLDYVTRLQRAGTSDIGSFVRKRMEAVMLDLERMPDTLGAKLYDFNDTLAGRLSRSITGGVDGLQPAAMDVWMRRWFGGVVDEGYLREMARHWSDTTFEGVAKWTTDSVAARLEKDGVTTKTRQRTPRKKDPVTGEKLPWDGTYEMRYVKSAPPDGVEYEYYLRLTNDFKDWANRTNWMGDLFPDGVANWQAKDVQAVMWVAQHKALNYVEQSPAGMVAMAGGGTNFNVIPIRNTDHPTYFPSPQQVLAHHDPVALVNIADDIQRGLIPHIIELSGARPAETFGGMSMRNGALMPSRGVMWTGSDRQIELALNIQALFGQMNDAVATTHPLFLQMKKAYPVGPKKGKVITNTSFAMDWLLPEGVDESVLNLLQLHMSEWLDSRGRGFDDSLGTLLTTRSPDGRLVARGLWEPSMRRDAKGVETPWQRGQALTPKEFETRIELDPDALGLTDGTWIQKYRPDAQPIPVGVDRPVVRVMRANNGDVPGGGDSWAQQFSTVLERAEQEGAQNFDAIADEVMGAPLLQRIGELRGDPALVRGRLDKVRQLYESAYETHAGAAFSEHRGAAQRASDGSAQQGRAVYFQRGTKGARAALQWDDERKARVFFLKGADPASGVHELAHYFSRDLDESAKALLIGARNDAIFPRRRTPYERSTQGAIPTSTRQYVVSDGRRAAAAGTFHTGVTRTFREHKYGRAVTVKDRDFYDDPANRLYLSGDGLAGAAVTPDGDLVSVYKHHDAVVDMGGLLSEAARYARTLDGFDIGGKLPDLYSQHGFRPAARVKWNDEYAPDGWDYARDGRPDIVLMVKDTEGVSNLPNAEKGYAAVREQVPLFTDWDDASNVQQAAKQRVAQRAPKPLKRGAKVADEWNRDMEEWFADEFIKYAGGGVAPNSVMQPVFNQFGEWSRVSLGDDFEQVSSEIKGIFDRFLTRDPDGPRAHYNLDEYRLNESFRIAVRRAEESAHTTQYFRRGRSWVERSVNHPYLGMYPASYMWGKIVPELFRFLVKKPFGVDAPFAGLAMASTTFQYLQLQLQTDENLQQLFADHPQLVRFFQLMVPGTPWDIPVNAPAWIRHISEQEHENRLRVQRGLEPIPIKAWDIISDTMGYAFGPGRFPATLGDIVSEFTSPAEQPKLRGARVDPRLAEARGETGIEQQVMNMAPPPVNEPTPDELWAQVGA